MLHFAPTSVTIQASNGCMVRVFVCLCGTLEYHLAIQYRSICFVDALHCQLCLLYGLGQQTGSTEGSTASRTKAPSRSSGCEIKPGSISNSRTSIFSASMMRGYPFFTPFTLHARKLCVNSFIGRHSGLRVQYPQLHLLPGHLYRLKSGECFELALA
jgi:hypothetical protein